MKTLLLALIQLYQITLSPALAALMGPMGGCRFTPSCSHYAREAIAIHGPWKGSVLSLARLLRCHPFCRGGHDPVPPSRAATPRNP